jgi:hypothetical protein
MVRPARSTSCDNFDKFPARDEQFPLAARFVVEPIGALIGLDLAIDQPQLALFGADISLGDIGLAFAQGFHLGASQHDAGLERIFHFIVAAGPAVLRDQPVGAALGLSTS